ncbi:MAG TPA: Gfo/Idh/MocA family oxidoreductase [Chthonomonadaceae bacterium]|nr:Gfo/Idh/MocA family oxidoreductase [Chthonomonadaceae bacterium]
MTLASNDFSRRDVVRAAGAAAIATAFGPSALAQEGKPIGVALVGGAHIHTPQYVSALRGRETVKVKYAWDHDPSRAEKRAKELSCKAVTDAREVWDDPEIQAVVICSETNRHHDLVMAGAHAKKHMFVEKPLGITAKESFAMAAAIEKANLLFTTGYFMRTDRNHLFVKEAIARGDFGKITRVRGSNCHSGSLGGWFDGEFRWMADPKIAGVGAFGDLGTHMLDILMWMLGGVETITADIQAVTNRYPGCDETGEALFRFHDGIIGTLAAGWVDVDNPVTLLVSGTEGHASIVNGLLYFHSNKVKGADGKDPWSELPPRVPLPISQFLGALEGKPHDNLVKPSEAAARVAVMEAAYKASQSRSWARVPQA